MSNNCGSSRLAYKKSDHTNNISPHRTSFVSHQPGVLDSSRSFSLFNDSLEIGCLSTTRKILGTGELNDTDRVARIAVRPMSVAESESLK